MDRALSILVAVLVCSGTLVVIIVVSWRALGTEALDGAGPDEVRRSFGKGPAPAWPIRLGLAVAAVGALLGLGLAAADRLRL
ncbi:MAG: hypothetical protein JWO60_3433 [Frankiales bacterium]|nr:hypothetical protein [Frankiales bacterium]